VFRRILATCLLVLILPMSAGAVSRDHGRPNPEPRVPVTGTTDRTPNGVVLQARGKATQPGKRNRVVKVHKSSCPDYRVVAQVTVVGAGSDNAKYGTYTYVCNGIEHTVFGCLDQCPPGQPQLTLPPRPADIRAEAEGFAIDPEGKFAPPVQRDSVSAITGLRLYATVTPNTYQQVTDDIVAPGGYQAHVVLTPGQVTLEANGKEVICPTNPSDPSTADGRDTSECYIQVTDVPDGGHEIISLSVEWTITVTSNIPGIENDEWTIERTTDLDIKVKQLQAVVET
jgi:hypothetical protein